MGKQNEKLFANIDNYEQEVKEKKKNTRQKPVKGSKSGRTY